MYAGNNDFLVPPDALPLSLIWNFETTSSTLKKMEEVQNEIYSATIEIRRCISGDLNGFANRTVSNGTGGDD